VPIIRFDGKSFINPTSKPYRREKINVTSERAIHTAMFLLILVGLCILTGWASYRYVEDWVLKIAAVALSWCVILLALYLVFKKFEWVWWS